MTYLLGAAALYLFLTWGYGDVLARVEQDSYISASTPSMHYLLTRPMGHVYWCFRWLLLAFKCVWAGALMLTVIYTLTARLADYTLRLPRSWEGLGFVLPWVQIGWMLSRGINLYYKNEPSLFLFIAAVVLAVVSVTAAVVWLVTRHKKPSAPASAVRPYGLLVALLLSAGITCAARYYNQNVILVARMQLMQYDQDWEGMVSAARTSRQPNRAVAAYHAIGLEEQDQLLDGMFDLVYEYPKERLDSLDGNEEYGIFLADCNFHAGLMNAAYRAGMDQTVMNGPRLYYLKRMAVCTLLNEEETLCRKYLTLIEENPFEGAFVEKCRAMLNDRKLVDADAELAHVKALKPQEDKFEQHYPSPAFLGYNTNLMSGSDRGLYPSIAACMYSKNLQLMLPRVQVLAQKGFPFPMCVQQAIAIMALKQPDLLKMYPQVGSFIPNEVRSFLVDAKPYSKDRLALRHNLRERWLGTYMYYYYTENNDPDQVKKAPDSSAKSGVN